MAKRNRVEVEIVATDEASDKLELVERKMTDVESDVTTVRIDADTAGLDQVARSADSSKSVLANMVGNATQDLGALGGVAGSAGVAIGQMGEYMVDASNSGDKLSAVFGNFASVAGPIAGIALAMKTLTDISARFADSQKRTTENQQRWTDAILSGGDAAAIFAEQLAEVGEITLDLTREQGRLDNVLAEINSKWYLGGGVSIFNSLLGKTTDETRNMNEAFVDAGITVDQFTSAVTGSADDQQRFIDAVKRTNLSAEDQNDIIKTLTQQISDYDAAQRRAADFKALFDPVGSVDFGHAPAAGIAAIVDANAARRAAVVNNIYNPPGTPAATVDLGNTYVVRNSMRTGS